MVAMIAADVGNAVLYHEEDEAELFQWSLIIPHIVCIVLLLDRLCGMRAKSGYTVSMFVSIWYILTTPLLRLLPVLT